MGTANETTLFRLNSPVTRMFKYYSKMIGIEYLFKTLAKYVAELEASQKQEKAQELELMNTYLEFEVDPTKMSQDEDENVNKLQLQLVVQIIFNSIMKSIPHMPAPILTICQHLKEVVKEHFPGKDLEYKAISAFLFLRFICPAIAAPNAYGLLPEPPSASVQRQLVLLSKILQNLANGLRFGKKEEFMMKLNDFIDSNILTLQRFYDHLSTPKDTNTKPYAIPATVKENALCWLHTHIATNFAKLNRDFDTYDFVNGKEVKAQLGEFLNKSPPPPDKLKQKA